MAIDRDRQLHEGQQPEHFIRTEPAEEMGSHQEALQDRVRKAQDASGARTDADQDPHRGGALDTGETRMWNAQEVREAAEQAAAEWNAECAALESDTDVPSADDDAHHSPDKDHRNKSPQDQNHPGKRQRGKRSRRSRAAQIVLGIAIAGILGTGGYCGWKYYSEEILPGREYDKAVSLRDAGELDAAIAEFGRLGDWGDAATQILETQLLKARNQIDGEAYEAALSTLAEVGDYEGAGELHTQDLIDEANQALSDLAYSKGVTLLKVYDYDSAADQFAAAQAYVARDDAAQLEEACEEAFNEVYAVSFAEGRDSTQNLQMTEYLWVHSVIVPDDPTVLLGMQSDLSTGSVNSGVFGQSYMNYVYYGSTGDTLYTFSYAGSEKDADEESRQVFLLAEFSDDYEQVTTSKVYADTGEVPAAPDIRLWNRVTSEDVIDAVESGIRGRLTMNLIALGEIDADEIEVADSVFTAYETIDDAFTLRTSEEIAAQEQAEAEAALQAAQAQDDAEDADESATDQDEMASNADADEEHEESDEDSDASDEDSGDADSHDDNKDAENTDDTDSDEQKGSDETSGADHQGDEEDSDATTDEEDAETSAYAAMTEEERKAKAEELERQAEEERQAAQQEAVDDLTSDYAILVDARTGEILVSKDADTRMYPASMTKIMTILVAAEHVTDLTERAEITNDILSYASERQLTTVGFSTGEEATIADLMWGTAVCSGADAAKALANYVAGSETNYVDLMNAKVQELGLEDTHFANCTGVFSESNYTTPHDMAIILHAAVQNPLARTILSTRQYTTSFTEEHPAGITITNTFLRAMDHDLLAGVVLSAKTGFVSQSMFCAASYMIADDGEIYICVTGHADTSAHCRADHIALYNAFAQPPSHTDIEKYLEEILSGESANVGVIEAEDAE